MGQDDSAEEFVKRDFCTKWDEAVAGDPRLITGDGRGNRRAKQLAEALDALSQAQSEEERAAIIRSLWASRTKAEDWLTANFGGKAMRHPSRDCTKLLLQTAMVRMRISNDRAALHEALREALAMFAETPDVFDGLGVGEFISAHTDALMAIERGALGAAKGER